jgi:hypothetical protein
VGGFSRFAEGKVGERKTRVLKAFLRKVMSKHRVFDGQFVVRCMVNVVLLTARFGSKKMGQVFEIYF